MLTGETPVSMLRTKLPSFTQAMIPLDYPHWRVWKLLLIPAVPGLEPTVPSSRLRAGL